MLWCGVSVRVWLAGGWGVRLGVGGSLGPCCGGLGVPLGLVGRVGVVGLPSLGACALVPCPLGVPVPSSGCCGRAVVLFWCLCGGPCGGGGRRLAVRAWWCPVRRCSLWLPLWV